jgi:hypothetical protein
MLGGFRIKFHKRLFLDVPAKKPLRVTKRPAKGRAVAELR